MVECSENNTMYAHIKSSAFIGGKRPRSLKIVILLDKGQCQFIIIIYLRMDVIFTESTKVHNTQHM